VLSSLVKHLQLVIGKVTMQNKDARGAMTNELAKKLNADANNDSKKAVPGEEQATGENSNPFPSCLCEARVWA
jgi:hypothetical protein